MSDVKPLSFLISSSVIVQRRAKLYKVSPHLTVYEKVSGVGVEVGGNVEVGRGVGVMVGAMVGVGASVSTVAVGGTIVGNGVGPLRSAWLI